MIRTEWLLEMCRGGAPIPKKGLLFSVQYLCKMKNIKTPFKDGMPGDKWFHNCLDRHPELSAKKAEYLSRARGKVTEQYIRTWFEEVKTLLGDNLEILQSGNPNRIWNMDETSIYLNPDGQLVMAERGKPASKTGACDKENVMVLICANAPGNTATPLALFGYTRMPPRISKIKKPDSWVYGKSENGWMTSAVMYEFIANEFYQYLVKQGVEFPVVIFVDGHVLHLSLPLSIFCCTHQIILIYLLPNCTNYLQVLDVVYFGPMKQKWKHWASLFYMKHGRDIVKEDIGPEMELMLRSHDFRNSLINGFKKCGMYPFNPDVFDYSKLITAPARPVSVNSSEDSTNMGSKTNMEIGLHALESQIPGKTLEIFYNTPNLRA